MMLKNKTASPESSLRTTSSLYSDHPASGHPAKKGSLPILRKTPEKKAMRSSSKVYLMDLVSHLPQLTEMEPNLDLE